MDALMVELVKISRDTKLNLDVEEPVVDQDMAQEAANFLGFHSPTPEDPEVGIWYIECPDEWVTQCEDIGYFERTANGYAVRADWSD